MGVPLLDLKAHHEPLHKEVMRLSRVGTHGQRDRRHSDLPRVDCWAANWGRRGDRGILLV